MAIVAEPVKKDTIVYTAKGIAIILLVLGHYHFPDALSRNEPEYWIKVGYFIFSFLMPFFAITSGYLFGLAEHSSFTWDDYRKFCIKRFKRLMFPYFSVSLLLVGVKYIASFVTVVQYPVDAHFWTNILFYPLAESYSSILWFLYALFLISISIPFVLFFIRHIFISLALGIILSFFTWPDIFCISKYFLLMPFFLIGYILYKQRILESDRYGMFLLLSVVSYLVFSGFAGYFDSTLGVRMISFFISLSGSFICLFGAVFLERKSSNFMGGLRILGYYSASIYLFHTMCMVPFRILIFQYLDFGKSMFLPSIVVVCGAGLIVPLFLDRYILRPRPVSALLFLGQKSSRPADLSEFH
jgi:fucose 4-O-acetylase-like acetyltransferase